MNQLVTNTRWQKLPHGLPYIFSQSELCKGDTRPHCGNCELLLKVSSRFKI